MKKKTNLSQQTLDIISQNKIKPIPKWEFILKNTALWFLFIFCLLLLILASALSWFGLIDNIITPYLWLFFTIFFFTSTFFIFEKTKGAYRFYRWRVLAVLALLATLFGAFLFRLGLANHLDLSLENSLPHYRQFVPLKLQAWNQPQSGYLSGTITKIINNDTFELSDFSQNVWTITSQNALIRGRVSLKPGTEIKLIGTQNTPHTFSATEIRPWNGPGQNILKEN